MASVKKRIDCVNSEICQVNPSFKIGGIIE